MGDIATDVTLVCTTPESLSQLLPPSELLKRPSSEVPTYRVSGSSGSTARHRAPRSSSVSSTLPFSTIVTAPSAAAYSRIIRNHPSRYRVFPYGQSMRHYPFRDKFGGQRCRPRPG